MRTKVANYFLKVVCKSSTSDLRILLESAATENKILVVELLIAGHGFLGYEAISVT